MRPSIWLKSTLVPFSLAFSSHSRFCVNDYIAKMYTKIACNIYSCRFDVRLQVMQPFLNFSCFFLTHKVPLITSFELRKSLKRMLSLAYTEMNQKETSLYINICIGMNFFDIYTHIDM